MDVAEDGAVCGAPDQIRIDRYKDLTIKRSPIRSGRGEIDPNSPRALIRRFAALQRNRLLRCIYTDWYMMLAETLPADIEGPLLEIGSGGDFSKTLFPELITSEIIAAPIVDVVLDGQRLPFGRDSLRGILMIDVFHHIPRVESFLSEARQCLKPGGVLAMIEPWITPWSRFIYTHFHPEPCRPQAADWHFPAGGPLSCANQALPWIVFKRDRRRFQTRCGPWEIALLELHSPFRYLLSGGFSFPNVLPGKAYGFIKKLEKRLRPFNPYLAMFATIVLKRI